MNLGIFSFVFCVWTLILSPHQKSALRRLHFKNQRREKTILITSSWLTKSAIKRRHLAAFGNVLRHLLLQLTKSLIQGFQNYAFLSRNLGRIMPSEPNYAISHPIITLEALLIHTRLVNWSLYLCHFTFGMLILINPIILFEKLILVHFTSLYS